MSSYKMIRSQRYFKIVRPLHGFCDAFIHPYAAAVYTQSDGTFVVKLLTAKSRVACKTITDRFSLQELICCQNLSLTKTNVR